MCSNNKACALNDKACARIKFQGCALNDKACADNLMHVLGCEIE